VIFKVKQLKKCIDQKLVPLKKGIVNFPISRGRALVMKSVGISFSLLARPSLGVL
jgi:hypothetical protein